MWDKDSYRRAEEDHAHSQGPDPGWRESRNEIIIMRNMWKEHVLRQSLKVNSTLFVRRAKTRDPATWNTGMGCQLKYTTHDLYRLPWKFSRKTLREWIFSDTKCSWSFFPQNSSHMFSYVAIQTNTGITRLTSKVKNSVSLKFKAKYLTSIYLYHYC